jgi:hypothetical protein
MKEEQAIANCQLDIANCPLEERPRRLSSIGILQFAICNVQLLVLLQSLPPWEEPVT